MEFVSNSNKDGGYAGVYTSREKKIGDLTSYHPNR